MLESLSYKNKRVIVSGCFSGMGEATARLLLKLGAEVHGLDYRDCQLDLASFSQVDLRDPASIEAGVQTIGGTIDALFNCAGLPHTSAPADVMKVNFIGTRHLTERVLPLMAEGGAIVSVSSNGGLGWRGRIPVLMELLKTDSFAAAVDWCETNKDTVREGYALSKEAIILWTMVSSFQLIDRGIRINCTTPGPTQTPMMANFEAATPRAVLDAAMQPINRRSAPHEQAGPLAFLNSDWASYINGVALPVDGGFMAGMATGLIDIRALTRGA
jgi:NAD(P)-dependent dehydrogenase (short-subunit alcohol dehydrogenase family)